MRPKAIVRESKNEEVKPRECGVYDVLLQTGVNICEPAAPVAAYECRSQELPVTSHIGSPTQVSLAAARPGDAAGRHTAQLCVQECAQRADLLQRAGLL